jgi:cytochrome c5
MLAPFALWMTLAGAGTSVDARSAYEVKCLFCHSAEVAQRPRLKPAQWRKVVESMRHRAPLLISRRDVELLTRYIVRDLRLVPPELRRARSSRALDPTDESAFPEEERLPTPPAPDEPEKAPAKQGEVPVPPPESASSPQPSYDDEAERLGPGLLENKCSKCHTLQRVFLKLDSIERGTALIERMRKKTGSGISHDEAELLLRFLQSRL